MADFNEKGHGWLGLVMVVVAGYLVWTSYDSGYEKGREVGIEEGITYATENNEELEICEYTMDEYQSALEEANTNIEDANFEIEMAQSNSGASYEDMQNALDGLPQIDTVDGP